MRLAIIRRLRVPRHALFFLARRVPHPEQEKPMSHAHDDDQDLPHEGPIKTPQQLIWAVVLAFVVPIIAIILLVSYVTADKKPAAGSDGMSEMAVAQRLQKIGTVRIKDPTDPATMETGDKVYGAQCVSCHGAGLSGAPKFGDAAAWAPRVKTGYEALLNSALKGKGNMTPQGGGDFSEFEIGRAVVYMANQGGANFPEPKFAAPAAAVAATAATATAAPTPAAPAATTAAAPAAPAVATMVAAAPAAAKAGTAPALYMQVCATCHAAGVANAPKLGDKAAWAPRLAAGVDGLTASAIKGKGAMPPKGTAMSASEADIKAVVAYMVASVK
jgi:cytochrome c5